MATGLLIAAAEHGPGLHGGLAGIGIALAVIAIAVVTGLYFAQRKRRSYVADAERDRGPEQ